MFVVFIDIFEYEFKGNELAEIIWKLCIHSLMRMIRKYILALSSTHIQDNYSVVNETVSPVQM